jgi:hypothetical protein
VAALWGDGSPSKTGPAPIRQAGGGSLAAQLPGQLGLHGLQRPLCAPVCGGGDMRALLACGDGKVLFWASRPCFPGLLLVLIYPGRLSPSAPQLPGDWFYGEKAGQA